MIRQAGKPIRYKMYSYGYGYIPKAVWLGLSIEDFVAKHAAGLSAPYIVKVSQKILHLF